MASMLHNTLFQDQEFKKILGRDTAPLPLSSPPHTPSAHAVPGSSCLWHLPLSKNPRSTTGSCNCVGCSIDVSSVSC